MRPEREGRQTTCKVIMATVYLRSKTGHSLLKEGVVAPSDPKPYLPTPETLQRAVTSLEQRGFTIESQGVTLSISGSPQLFEQSCGVKIFFDEITCPEPAKMRPGTQLVSRSSKPVMQIQGLEDSIEGIVLATPGIPFKRS